MTPKLGLSPITQACLLVALSAILYGFMGYLGTYVINDNMSIICMLFWRFAIAGTWMMIFVIKDIITQEKINLQPHVLVIMFLLSAAGYSGSSGFYFVSSQSIGTGLAMVIFFSYPIAIALYSWLVHRQPMSIQTLLTLLLMFVGLILLHDFTGHLLSIHGLFMGLLSAFSYALYIIGSKKFAHIDVNSNLLTMIVCFGSACLFLILSLSSHTFIFPQSTISWLSLLVFGIFVTAIPIQLMLNGLKHISATRASIISVLEPLITVIVGIILLHESVTLFQFIGGFLILSSAIFVQFQKI